VRGSRRSGVRAGVATLRRPCGGRDAQACVPVKREKAPVGPAAIAHKHSHDAESKMLARQRWVVKNSRNGATYVARCGSSSSPRCASRPGDEAQPAVSHTFPAASAAAMATYLHSAARGWSVFHVLQGARGCPVAPGREDHRPRVGQSTRAGQLPLAVRRERIAFAGLVVARPPRAGPTTLTVTSPSPWPRASAFTAPMAALTVSVPAVAPG